METLVEKYRFKEYDPAYAQAFELERMRLAAALGEGVRLEHIGSTAVPGLGGKGVIDIYAVVSEGSVASASIILKGLGYEYRPHASTSERLFHKAVVLDPHGIKRPFQLHLSGPSCLDFQYDLAFRDWLRSHPEDRERYNEIKRRASEVAQGDTETYKNLKDGVMREITERARATQLPGQG